MDQIDLSIKSRTLLDMADEVISSDSEIVYEYSDPTDSTELTSIAKLKQQSILSKKPSRISKQKVSSELEADLKSNQEILDSFFGTNKQSHVNRSFKTNPKSRTSSSKAKENSSQSIIQYNGSKIKKNDEISKEERKICELEYQLALAHKELNQEKEMRKCLASEISSLVSVISSKSLNITPSSLKAASQLFEKIKEDKPKLSSVRLLSKELETIRKDLSEETQLPNPKIADYYNDNAISKALNEVSISLAKDFFNEDVTNITSLSKNPLELAKTVNRMRRAHDIGISELKARIGFLEERLKKQEQNEMTGTISQETTDLLNSLTRRMQNLSEQSHREYEDLIENSHE